MNLIDSSGCSEYFADSADAGFSARPIADNGRVVVPTIGLFQVCLRVPERRGENAATRRPAHMWQGDGDALDAEIAFSAAHLGRSHELPLADAIMLATARRYGAPLWIQDADIEGIDRVHYAARTQ